MNECSGMGVVGALSSYTQNPISLIFLLSTISLWSNCVACFFNYFLFLCYHKQFDKADVLNNPVLEF